MVKKLSVAEMRYQTDKHVRAMCAANGKPIPEGFDSEKPVAKEVKTRAPSKPSEVPTEHEEQKNFIKWFRLQYPKVLIWAPPMAAVRSDNTAAWLKAEGMVKGIPDLHVPAWKLVIEMKRTKGSNISAEQYWMEAHFKSIGWHHFFAYGAEDAKLKLMGVAK